MNFSAAPLPQHSVTPAPLRLRRRARVRGTGAAAATIVLFGSAILAPFSVSTAFADDGQAVDLRGQGLTAATAAERMLDYSVDGVEAEPAKPAAAEALYTLEQFLFSGVVNWGGYKFTFYSERVLPGPGLQIPGRHVSEAGYVTDADGFIVLAGSAPKGTVYETPFGAPGKIYDRGTVGNHLDVYVR